MKVSTPKADLVGRFDQQIFALYPSYEKFLQLVEKKPKENLTLCQIFSFLESGSVDLTIFFNF